MIIDEKERHCSCQMVSYIDTRTRCTYRHIKGKQFQAFNSFIHLFCSQYVSMSHTGGSFIVAHFLYFSYIYVFFFSGQSNEKDENLIRRKSKRKSSHPCVFILFFVYDVYSFILREQL